MKNKKRIFAVFIIAAMLLMQIPFTPVAFAAGPDEQFTGLNPGSTYYFDLSAQGIPGTVNSSVLDTGLHWVPFTYAGTVTAYSLDAGSIDNPDASTAAGASPSDRSLFVADYYVTNSVSWNSLNASGFIFGKPYVRGGVSYSLRVLSGGSSKPAWHWGIPENNEWDTILDKDANYIKNLAGNTCWGQDSYYDTETAANYRVTRGTSETPHQYAIALPDNSGPGNRYRPALEITSAASELKTVTFDMNGNGTLGDGTLTLATVVYTGTLTLPNFTDAGFNYTGPSGGKNLTGWFDADENYYAQGAALTDLPTGTTLKASYGVLPTITTSAAFPEGRVGEPYSLTLEASGSTPITWSAPYVLPGGISLDPSTGVISGTPTMSSTATADIIATNKFGYHSINYTLIIQPAWTYLINVDSISHTFTGATTGYDNSSMERQFSITNIGTGTITGLSASWTGGSGFEISTPLSGNSIVSSGTVTVSVRPVAGLSAGTYTDTLNITGDHGISQAIGLSFTVSPPSVAPDIITTSQSPGTRDVAYSDYVLASGTAPITWSIISGALPDGLSLNASTGYITGTPAKSGVFSFIIKAENTAGSDTQELSINIVDPDISTVANACNDANNATYGDMTQTAVPDEAAISAALKAIAVTAVNNGTVNVSIIKNSYTAPIAGDADDPDGTNGSYTFVVNVSKGAQSQDTTAKTIAITAAPFAGLTNQQAVAAAKTAIMDGIVSVAHGAAQAEKTAAVQSYVNGLLSAVPDAAGVTATVTNISGNQYNVALAKGSASDSKSINMVVNEGPAPVAPSIITESQSNGVIGVDYSDYVSASGTAPITWSIISGSLPDGLNLNSSTGYITGTPTAMGTSTFTVKAENSAGSDTQELSIIIVDPDLVAVNAAYDKASTAAYGNMTQAEASDETVIANALKAIAVAAVNDGTVNVSIIKNSYTAPVAGNLADPAGTNGEYAFKINLTKGVWNRDISNKTITITATPYVLTDADMVTLAKAAIVDGTVSVAHGAAQADKTAAVQSYVDSIISNTANAAGVTAAVTYNSGTGKYDVALSKGSESGSKSLSMTVNETAAPAAPTITTAALPDALAGEVYSKTLMAEGDTPITWSIESGTLPIGLILNGDSGKIAGSPLETGTFTFAVKAQNSVGQAVRTLTLTVRTLQYAAFGDSIANGYGLADQADSYVSIVKKALGLTTANAAMDGVTSKYLLENLDGMSGNPSAVAMLSQVEVITLSIGSNDVLGPFLELIADELGCDTDEIQQTVAYLSAYHPESLVAACMALNAEGTGLKNNPDLQAAASGFSGNFRDIIVKLKALAPNAKIYVTNIYNPYQGISLNYGAGTLDLGAIAEGYINTLNTAFDAASSDYTLIDVHTSFENAKQAGTSPVNADLATLNFDPHPNKAGHALIASLILEAQENTPPASPTVDNVLVNPPAAVVEKGGTKAFTATVTGSNSPAQTVSWSVTGNTSMATDISSSGLLTVGPDETAAALTVTATSVLDNTKSGTAAVTVTQSPAVYTVTFNLNGGTRTGGGDLTQTVAQGGSATAPIVTRSGYSFNGWDKAFANVTSDLTVTAAWNKNNSEGSGGGSSGGAAAPVISVDKQPDMPTTVKMNVSGTAKDGILSATITEQMVKDAIKAAQEAAKKSGKAVDGIAVDFNVIGSGSYSNLNATIDAGAIDRLKEAGMKFTKISSSVLDITLDTEAITELDKQSTGTVTVSARAQTKLSKAAKALIGSRPVFDITVSYQKNGKTENVTSFGKATVTLGIAYKATGKEKAGSLFGVYVDKNGKPQLLTNSSYAGGKLIFGRNSLSTYGVGYKTPAPAFTDTAKHWAKDNIDFVASRELINGTGTTTFAPDTAITRADFLLALGRLSGADVSAYKTGSFTDVKATDSAMPYIEWAVKAKIVQGIGDGKFGPALSVSRQDMAVMMQNYAKATGYKVPVTVASVTFSDSAKIAAYAREAVKVIQQAGIMQGKGNNTFDPQDSATRAEASAILRHFVEFVIDEGTARGWVQNDAGQWQYIGENGKAVTGWLVTESGKYNYYLGKDGIMVAGEWLQIDSKWYYFYADGSLAKNTKVDGYEVDENGVRKNK